MTLNRSSRPTVRLLPFLGLRRELKRFFAFILDAISEAVMPEHKKDAVAERL